MPKSVTRYIVTSYGESTMVRTAKRARYLRRWLRQLGVPPAAIYTVRYQATRSGIRCVLNWS